MNNLIFYFLHFLFTTTHDFLAFRLESFWQIFLGFFFPFHFFVDELVLESLLLIFNMLHLTSGLCSPAGSVYINLMTFLLFLNWRDGTTHGSSEFAIGAVSAAESPELVHSYSSEQCPVAQGHQPNSQTSIPMSQISVLVQCHAWTPNPGTVLWEIRLLQDTCSTAVSLNPVAFAILLRWMKSQPLGSALRMLSLHGCCEPYLIQLSWHGYSIHLMHSGDFSGKCLHSLYI